MNPEKIIGGKIIVPDYDELMKHIPGLILPSNPSEIVNIEIVSIFTLCITNTFQSVLMWTREYMSEMILEILGNDTRTLSS